MSAEVAEQVGLLCVSVWECVMYVHGYAPSMMCGCGPFMLHVSVVPYGVWVWFVYGVWVWFPMGCGCSPSRMCGCGPSMVCGCGPSMMCGRGPSMVCGCGSSGVHDQMSVLCRGVPLKYAMKVIRISIPMWPHLKLN